jgi:hypothetical protein
MTAMDGIVELAGINPPVDAGLIAGSNSRLWRIAASSRSVSQEARP